ncbi:putative inhibitor of apoptosis, partial [Astathelohania contejeani]
TKTSLSTVLGITTTTTTTTTTATTTTSNTNTASSTSVLNTTTTNTAKIGKNKMVDDDCINFFLERTCKICMDKKINVIILPCKHMVICSTCLLSLQNCPICRQDILYIITPIIS